MKKTTEKEVIDLKKTVARLEKKILLMKAEIKKKQDKKITITIGRRAIRHGHQVISSFFSGIQPKDAAISKL